MAPSMSSVTHSTVLLLGDSFMQRLGNWASDNDKVNLNLGPSRVKEIWHGLGGMLVNRSAKKNMWHHTESVLKNNPTVVVLSIGSNDLWARSVSPETVCNRILEFVTFCMQQGVSKTVVLQLLSRNYQYPTFNDKVYAVNDLLREESMIRDSIYLREHSRQLFNSWYLDDFVDSDWNSEVLFFS